MYSKYLALALVVSLTACKADKPARQKVTTYNESAETPSPTAAAPPPTAINSSTSFVGQALDITNTRVSYFALNLPLPTPSPTDSYYYSMVPTTVVTEEGEQEELRKYVVENGQPMLSMRLSPESTEKKSIPTEIFVISPRFRNSTGIHVGSTLADIQAAGAPFKIWYSYVTDKFVLEFEGQKPQYILEPEGFAGTKPTSSDKVNIEANELSASTKVKEIRLY